MTKPEAVPDRGLFVVGTDTDVGKTAVAVAIVRFLVAAGHRVGVYKPVASGIATVDDPSDRLSEMPLNPFTSDSITFEIRPKAGAGDDPVGENSVDRIIRIVIGLLLISLVFTGPETMWGWLGLPLLISGLFGWCGLYSLMKVDTCRKSK